MNQWRCVPFYLPLCIRNNLGVVMSVQSYSVKVYSVVVLVGGLRVEVSHGVEHYQTGHKSPFFLAKTTIGHSPCVEGATSLFGLQSRLDSRVTGHLEGLRFARAESHSFMRGVMRGEGGDAFLDAIGQAIEDLSAFKNALHGLDRLVDDARKEAEAAVVSNAE